MKNFTIALIILLLLSTACSERRPVIPASMAQQEIQQGESCYECGFEFGKMLATNSYRDRSWKPDLWLNEILCPSCLSKYHYWKDGGQF